MKLTKETLKRIIKRACSNLNEVGEVSAEQVIKNYLEMALDYIADADEVARDMLIELKGRIYYNKIII